METVSVASKTSTSNVARAKNDAFSLPRLFGTTWEQLQFNYYAVVAMTILVGSCLAGIAAANILSNNVPTWQLAACTVLGMFNNTTAIGNMPVKWVVWSFIIATIGNVILIALNIF